MIWADDNSILWTEEQVEDAHVKLLTQLVEAGELDITYIVGPPRTVTTALATAIGQSKDVGVQNVFHEKLGQSDFMDDLEEIMEKTTPGEKTHIVIKEMSDEVANPELAAISKHVIITTREPVQQLFAHAPQKLFAQKLANLSAHDMFDNAEDPESHVVNEMASNVGKVRKTARCAESFLSDVLDVKDPSEVSIVEGDLFRTDPESIMPELCARSGIDYDQRTLKDWDSVHDACDYWTGVHKNSDRILKPVQQTPKSNALCERRPETGSLIQDYTELLSSPYCVKPNFVDFLTQTSGMLCGESGDTRFDQLEPITAYALASSYTLADPTLQRMQDSYLQGLREQFDGEHSAAFDAVDSVRGAKHAPSTKVQDAQEPSRTGERLVSAHARMQ